MTVHNSEELQTCRQPATQRSEDSSPAAHKAPVNRRQLSLLGLVIVCGAGAMMFAFKSGPQAANAAAAPASAALGEMGEFMAADTAAARRMEQTVHDAGRVADLSRLSPGMTQVPVTELKTNPFRLRTASAQPAEVPDDSTESRDKEQERQATLLAVQSLQLQSILRGGSHRACLINNTLYQEGQEVAGFMIEEISLTTVVVRRDVYRFELKVTN